MFAIEGLRTESTHQLYTHFAQVCCDSVSAFTALSNEVYSDVHWIRSYEGTRCVRDQRQRYGHEGR